MNLYEIDAAILGCVDAETGEIVDADALDKLEMERGRKVENVALWIKDLDADAAALKAEKLAFADRQAKAEKKAERLREYLGGYLAGEKFETARVAVSFRRSERVVVTDKSLLPEEYLAAREPEPDKAAIKAAIKAGAEVAGAKIEECSNMQIR